MAKKPSDLTKKGLLDHVSGKSGITGPRGLFIVGTDTAVGKTYVAACIARSLVAAGKRVGVYKPVASGCHKVGNSVVSDDGALLWEAAGRPGHLQDVCPQRFLAPLAPHLAAEAEGKTVDGRKLRRGLQKWVTNYDLVIVEGAGGWMSPVSEDDYVADLAAEFGFPLVVVSANRLGTINQTLQTLIAISAYAESLQIAGVVLNDTLPISHNDVSTSTNPAELRARCVPPILAHLQHGAESFRPKIDWWRLAAQ